MFGTKKRTYGSKKSEVGSIRDRDILRAVPDTNTLFDALSAANIKKYRKDNSYLFPNRLSTFSTVRTKPNLGTKRRKPKAEKNIKVDKIPLDSSSDLSLHVKHNSNDLFDQLKDSIIKQDEVFDNLLNGISLVGPQNVDPRLNLTTDSSDYSPAKQESFKEPSFELIVQKKKKSYSKKHKIKPVLNLTTNGNTSHSIREFNFVVEPHGKNVSCVLTPEAVVNCKENIWNGNNSSVNFVTSPIVQSKTDDENKEKCWDDSILNFDSLLSQTFLPSSTPYGKTQNVLRDEQDTFNNIASPMNDVLKKDSQELINSLSIGEKEAAKFLSPFSIKSDSSRDDTLENVDPKLLQVPVIVLDRLGNVPRKQIDQLSDIDSDLSKELKYHNCDSDSDVSFHGFPSESEDGKPESLCFGLSPRNTPLLHSPDIFSCSSYEMCYDGLELKTKNHSGNNKHGKHLINLENNFDNLSAKNYPDSISSLNNVNNDDQVTNVSSEINEYEIKNYLKSSESLNNCYDCKISKMVPVVVLSRLPCESKSFMKLPKLSKSHSDLEINKINNLIPKVVLTKISHEDLLRNFKNSLKEQNREKWIEDNDQTLNSSLIRIRNKKAVRRNVLKSREDSGSNEMTRKKSRDKLVDEKLTKLDYEHEDKNEKYDVNINVENNDQIEYDSPIRLRNKKIIQSKICYDNKISEMVPVVVLVRLPCDSKSCTVLPKSSKSHLELKIDKINNLTDDLRGKQCGIENKDQTVYSSPIRLRNKKTIQRKIVLPNIAEEKETIYNINEFEEQDLNNESNMLLKNDDSTTNRTSFLEESLNKTDCQLGIPSVSDRNNKFEEQEFYDEGNISLKKDDNPNNGTSFLEESLNKTDCQSGMPRVSDRNNEFEEQELNNKSNLSLKKDDSSNNGTSFLEESLNKTDCQSNVTIDSHLKSVNDSFNQSLFNNTCMFVTKRDPTRFTGFSKTKDSSKSSDLGYNNSCNMSSIENHSSTSPHYAIEAYNIDNPMINMTKRDTMCRKTIAPRQSIILEPGKRWERSLNILRNMNRTNLTMNDSVYGLNGTVLTNGPKKGRMYNHNVTHLLELQNPEANRDSFYDTTHHIRDGLSTTRRYSVMIVEEPTLREDFDESQFSQRSALSSLYTDSCNDTKVNLSRVSLPESDRSKLQQQPQQCGVVLETDPGDEQWSGLSARDIVLRRCKQSEPLPFDVCYPPEKLRKCFKIGEGVYGEVFLYKNEEDPSNPIVMKVIPIEGELQVNGDRQKKFSEIISEIVIAMELSDLRNSKENSTTVFNKVNRVRCVQGCYPESLIDLWELYDEQKGSDNDNPSIFQEEQLYIVLELANGGNDLEAFRFKDAEQAYYLFFQVAYALAVAEESYQFEHRDLHWGNILISNSDQQSLKYKLRGEEYSVPSCDIQGCIIDYTLSRITLPTSHLSPARRTIYNDLSKDPDLFNADGDYQFDIYRLMKEKNGDSWQYFEPFTNILWLHYTSDKMISALRYERTDTRTHEIFISKLSLLKDTILQYDSCVDFVTSEQCFALLHEI